MGTNYYIIKRKGKDEVKKYSRPREAIHLCKISCGWHTIFDHHWGKYYKPTKESINEFLKESDAIIQDEYGCCYSIDEFWEKIKSYEDLYQPLFDMKKYCLEKKLLLSLEGINTKKVFDTFSIQTEYSDFWSDGLRFSVEPDFC